MLAGMLLATSGRTAEQRPHASYAASSDEPVSRFVTAACARLRGGSTDPARGTAGLAAEAIGTARERSSQQAITVGTPSSSRSSPT
jgi:hypothetical protein